ncbi:MAG TPA: hypothetical protein VL357_03425 [Rariglobus sp.]|jgi:hypothetical protein|nr:hypothetical protein [Rariglobus sp.]
MKPTAIAFNSTADSDAVHIRRQPITSFRWLLLLGIPPAIAAHLLAPDVFQPAWTGEGDRLPVYLEGPPAS